MSFTSLRILTQSLAQGQGANPKNIFLSLKKLTSLFSVNKDTIPGPASLEEKHLLSEQEDLGSSQAKDNSFFRLTCGF